MESIRWIFIQGNTVGNDWYNERTLDYTRKQSKALLLDRSSMDWDEAKKYGWRCVKVKLTLTDL